MLIRDIERNQNIRLAGFDPEKLNSPDMRARQARASKFLSDFAKLRTAESALLTSADLKNDGYDELGSPV